MYVSRGRSLEHRREE
jgi:hypothetical protein